MTLVEFLHPLSDSSMRNLCLSAMYFCQRYEGTDSTTIDGLRAVLKRARIPKADKLNLADTLSKSAPYVDAHGKEGNKFLWSLTPSGQDYVRQLLGLPARNIEIENDVSSLETLISKLSDADVIDYTCEALKCLEVNALRATVVFLWAAVVQKVRDEVFSRGIPSLNSAIEKFDPKAKVVQKLDDLVLVKESTLLLAAQELGIYDKNQKSILEECLNLRNKCGHPGKYKVGAKKVSSFIEDVIGIVFK
jgi:hypothetical protein